MRRNTKSRAASDRLADKLRREFVERFPNCWVCGVRGVQCHEICQGNRAEAVKHPANYLAVCMGCHEAMHDKSQWPVARQMALAWKCGDYSMEAILKACNELSLRNVCEQDFVPWLRVVGI